MKKLSATFLASFVLLSGGLALAQNPVRVGSKPFTENIVLAKMIITALDNADIPTNDQTPLGTTDVNRTSLVTGEIDVYPEYTGTAISNFLVNEGADVPEGASSNAEESYRIVSEYDLENNLRWLAPAPANNTFAVAVTEAFAEEHGLKTMGDYAEYVNNGGRVMMPVGDEFAQRPDGLAAFEEVYGFDLSEDQLLIIAGGTPAQTEQALAEGANGANAAMAYGTDGALMAYNFVVLEDPEGAQPIFQPTAVFRAEVVETYPNIPELLNPIFETLDNKTLQELNARVDVDGESPDAVARSYLEENGFLE